MYKHVEELDRRRDSMRIDGFISLVGAHSKVHIDLISLLSDAAYTCYSSHINSSVRSVPPDLSVV